MIKRIITLVFLFAHVSLFAQDEYQLPDRELNEVEITAKTMKYYSQGAHIQSFDSTQLALANDGSLANLLRDKAGVHIREYGVSGQLSTISMRGASPENTAIVWNGINLNSMTTGQTDMSTINTFYFDNIDVHYGASSAQYGSGAVGGAILLQDNIQWNQENHYELQTAYGSFNQQFYGFKAQYGQNKWRHKTAILFQKADNDFTFYNPYAGENQTQNNAGFQHAGVMHETHYKPTENSEISLNLWYTQDERAIQPIMGDNLNPSRYDSLSNENFRAVINYKLDGKKWTHNASLAYVNDYLLNGSSKIASERIISDYRAETALSDKATLLLGGNFNNIWPDVYAYAANTTELRTSVFAALRYDFTDRFSTSINLRQEWVTDYVAPFTPSLNLTYAAIDNQKNRLIIKSTAARSYRVPTLNERYWGGETNSEIKPEDGYNVDLGGDYTLTGNTLRFNLNVTGFYLRTYNKILWVPGNPTYAKNIKDMRSFGVESAAKLDNYSSNQRLKWVVGISYTFTDAQDMDKDKQLIYVPKSQLKNYATLSYSKWFFNLDHQAIGKRTTINDYYNLDGFNVFNASIGKSIELNKTTLRLTFKVNNLTDEVYQNYEEFPMPGRNFMLKANFTI
ncbi:TonB-dependent receptor plug domain-containing protein [Flammeovirga sp. MY04]|uniref:TonB-dependent receptor n=1 Tax=Flammeovirga sp. MY04 TaxID=1191459 RepID=UPI0008062D91|nr:TonB-dependent receptor plug domain-containing protein [Flammeovirga sp. MY04]ANQ48121.1 TonB-dependent receptor plug domain-containing protein [Flammeovirga sp. MY04]